MAGRDQAAAAVMYAATTYRRNVSRKSHFVDTMALILLLAGCQTPPPRVVTVREPVEVQVAVPVPCRAVIPPRPVLLTDAEILALPDGDAVRALRRRDLELQVWAAELEVELKGCAGQPATAVPVPP